MRLSRATLTIMVLPLLVIGCNAPQIAVSPNSTLETSPTAASTIMPTTEPVNRVIAPEVSDLAVTYVLEGNVWIWREETGARQLNASGNAQRVLFSDDGELIAYTRMFDGDETEIWVVGSDGSGDRQVVSVEQISAMPRSEGSLGMRLGKFLWVPHSHMIAFSTHEISGEVINMDTGVIYYTEAFNYSNQLVNVDNGVLTTLFEPGEGGQLFYSPDASQVAVVTPDSIRVFNADGFNERLNFRYDTNMHYSDLQAKFYARPVWSSDSSLLMVSIPHVPDYQEVVSEATDEKNTTEIWILPTGNAPAQFIGSFEDYFVFPYFPPVISPNMTSVIYSTQRGEEYELHHVNTVGENDVLIASAPFIFIKDWAPDSQKFVFAINDFSGELKLGKAGEIGYSDLADVTNVANYTWIDENRILFTTRPEDDQPVELRIGLVDGLSVLVAEISSYFISSVDFVTITN